MSNPPIPFELGKLRGNPGKRRLKPEPQPQIEAKCPEAPDWLSDYAGRKIGVLANAFPNIPPHGCPKEGKRRSWGITDLHKLRCRKAAKRRVCRRGLHPASAGENAPSAFAGGACRHKL